MKLHGIERVGSNPTLGGNKSVVLNTNFSFHFPSWKVILVFLLSTPQIYYCIEEALDVKMCLPPKKN